MATALCLSLDEWRRGGRIDTIREFHPRRLDGALESGGLAALLTSSQGIRADHCPRLAQSVHFIRRILSDGQQIASKAGECEQVL